MARRKLINVDFQKLERQSYKNMSSLGKEIIDKMIEMSSDTKSELTEYQKAALDLVKEAMGSLTETQQSVINSCFGLDGSEPKTEKEVADELGISRNAVHGAKSRALNTLRKLIILNEKVVKNLNNSKKHKKD